MHQPIRDILVMPYITGDFFHDHLKEVADGKYFALEKPNNGNAPLDVCCIVLGSTWRCLGVAESSSDVADFLLSHYDNFMQFAGQKDGATRYAQVLQFLLADHTFGGILVSLER